MIKNYKHKKACLSSSVSRRGSQETLNQKGVMMVKNKHSKGLPFLKNGVYVKDTSASRVSRLSKEENDLRRSTNTLYTQSISRLVLAKAGNWVGARVVSPMSIVDDVTMGESRSATTPKQIRRRVNSKVYPLFSLVFLLALSGCMGVYEGGFECPAGVGVGCKSISEVNDLVNDLVIARELPKASPSSVSAQEPEIWYSPSFIRECIRHKRVHDKVPS